MSSLKSIKASLRVTGLCSQIGQVRSTAHVDGVLRDTDWERVGDPANSVCSPRKVFPPSLQTKCIVPCSYLV